MGKKLSSGVNKSDEIRKLLQANPDISAKEVIATLDKKGISVTDSLYYFVKGKMQGRSSRHQKAVTQDFAATGSANEDAVKTIRKVKEWANEVGGMKKLKALVEALSG